MDIEFFVRRSDEHIINLFAQKNSLRLPFADLLALFEQQVALGPQARVNRGVEGIGTVGVIQ